MIILRVCVEILILGRYMLMVVWNLGVIMF